MLLISSLLQWGNVNIFFNRSDVKRNFNCDFKICFLKWGKMVTEGIVDAVHNRLVLVKFVEQVEFEERKNNSYFGIMCNK